MDLHTFVNQILNWAKITFKVCRMKIEISIQTPIAKLRSGSIAIVLNFFVNKCQCWKLKYITAFVRFIETVCKNV